MKDLQVSRVAVRIVSGNNVRLSMWTPTTNGCYRTGVDCIEWVDVQLLQRETLRGVITICEGRGPIDSTYPTREVLSGVFGRPGWKEGPISGRLEKLIESKADLSLLLSSNRRHMPIYFTRGAMLVAVWDPLAGVILVVEELPGYCENFYRMAFDNTKRVV